MIYISIDDDGHGPSVGDTVSLCGFPEMCSEEKAVKEFRLSCLRIDHFSPVLPNVNFRAAVSPFSDPELSEVIEPVQSYLLSHSVENNYFTDPKSIIECVELLNASACSALHSGYDVWTYIDICAKEHILKYLVSSCKTIQSAECADRTNLNISAPETFCVQNVIPRQPPMIDSAKVKSVVH